MNKGIIFDIKEFTVHDGPGIRTTVFFKGCPLRCKWCHNPEGISSRKQLMVAQSGCTKCGNCRIPCGHAECIPFGRCAHICPNGLIRIVGEEVDAADLARLLKRQSDLLEAGEGGITISGGEPLAQPEFLLEFLEELQPLNTIIETSGYADAEIFQKAAERCSMIYLDIKHLDNAVHREMTGVDNTPILKNLQWLKRQEKAFIVRVPLIPGINDGADHLARIAEALKDARQLQQVELLPYNPFTKAKYDMASMEFQLDIAGQSSPPDIPVCEFEKNGIPVRIL